MIGIYKITNPKGRIYVGQSIDIEKRFNQYKQLTHCKSQKKLYNSLKKYGISEHVFEVLEECSLKELNRRERYWQEYFNVLHEGLNLLLTSTEQVRTVFSEETRRKISESLKGNTPWNKGRQMPQDTKNKISEKLKGRKLSEDTKEKRRGNKQSQETINKRVSSRRNNSSIWHSEETLEKMKGPRKPYGPQINPQKSKTEEHKEKLRGPRGTRGPQQKVKCPYCLKEGGNTMSRWHFENCKQKL
ncbi:MAG TPA: NUMOD3 domain-containing DNA-binding protein [Candidatus Absconditabacterales bacterium]|nr:NUMOD3 domain-containing DNA-binding protein [Candidatus Absconditabacterales bacterium]